MALGAVFVRSTPEPLAVLAARHGPLVLMLLMALLVLAAVSGAQTALRRRAAELAEANQNLAREIELRADAEASLRHAQKLEAMGQLTGGVAHDFNNLLMVVAGGVEMLERSPDEPRRIRVTRAIRDAVDRGASLTQQLLAFSRKSPLRREFVSLSERFENMHLLLERSLREDVHIDLRVPKDVWGVEVDVTQLQTAVLNVAVNARDAMPKGGRIVIAAENRRAPISGGETADLVRISISDEG